MRISPKISAPFISVFYRIWTCTLRIEEVGREAVDKLGKDGAPMIFSLWHDEFFTLMKVKKNLELLTIVSANRRGGEQLALLLESLKLHTVRGSSHWGGLKALLKASRILREKKLNGCVVTLDGPLGPRHMVKEGAVFLAMTTPAHIVPVRLFPQKSIKFNSWDKFQLPWPFSKVKIVFSEPYLPESLETSQENIKKECLILQDKLDNMEDYNSN